MRDGALVVLAAGEAALVLCSIAYVTWWVLAFRPPITSSRPVWGGYLVAAVGFGGLGALAVLAGTAWAITRLGPLALAGAVGAVLGGVLLYPTLAAFTTGPLGRPLTTELPLIVLWTTVQVAAWAALSLGGSLTGPAAIAGWAAIAVTVVVGLGCYLAFYRLPPVPAYVAGMAPLALAGAASALLGYLAVSR